MARVALPEPSVYTVWYGDSRPHAGSKLATGDYGAVWPDDAAPRYVDRATFKGPPSDQPRRVSSWLAAPTVRANVEEPRERLGRTELAPVFRQTETAACATIRSSRSGGRIIPRAARISPATPRAGVTTKERSHVQSRSHR